MYFKFETEQFARYKYLGDVNWDEFDLPARTDKGELFQESVTQNNGC